MFKNNHSFFLVIVGTSLLVGCGQVSNSTSTKAQVSADSAKASAEKKKDVIPETLLAIATNPTVAPEVQKPAATAAIVNTKNDNELLQDAAAVALCAPLQPSPTTYLVKQMYKAVQTPAQKESVAKQALSLGNLGEKLKLYFDKNATDFKEFKNIIIGDSTMQITSTMLNSMVPNLFYNTDQTQLLAITGNKLCDMLAQMSVIYSKNPKNVIIASAGGNDLLAKATPEYVINMGSLLFLEVRRRFPNARIVFVGVHPSLDSYANANKGATNQGISALVKKDPNACWYDPMELFGVSEGQPAKATDMLLDSDGAHYKPETIGLALKLKIKLNCGVDF